MGRDPDRRGSTISLDAQIMRRCLDLARRAEGRTSPNPMVGAVVARGGHVISQAFHRRAGGPHAEVAALRRAGAAARGSTLYVNLEPCSHFGRTPPCVGAILESGVRRVVASHRDPFLLVCGRGFAALRRAGVRVEVGLLRAEALHLNERYLAYVSRGRPFVLVKAAMTLDGRIATAAGESRWISSPPARARAHRLRAIYDAVMVGANTAFDDDPRLTSRAARRNGRQPLRIVVDSRLRISPRARMLRTSRKRSGGSVIIYTTHRASPARASRLVRAGAQVVRVGRASSRRVDLIAALEDLGRRGASSVMIEGGGELIGSALEAGAVDKVALFVAPMILGGRRALPVVAGHGAARLRQAVRLEGITITRVGHDFLLEGYIAGRGR